MGRYDVAHDEIDIAIVGAGAAGCVVARRLAESGRSVLLLEAGPLVRPESGDPLRDGWVLPRPPDWGFQSEPDTAGATQPLRRGRLTGGTSWLTRFAVRGAASDFDGWAAAGNPGWAFEDVLPAFRRLETDAEFGDRPWHGSDGPLPITRYPDLARSAIHEAAIEAFGAVGFAPVEDHNAPGAVGVGPMPMNGSGGERVTTFDAWLPAGWDSPTLSIRPDTVVARVLVEGGRAVGVELADGSAIRAALVILSAGTYGSPPILLRSGLGPSADLRVLGITPIVDLQGVGANLTDHVGVDLPSGWEGEAPSGPLLHSLATFRSSLAASDDSPDLLFWASDPVAADPAFYLDPILMRPRSRGSVSLRSADPADPPRIELPGLGDPSDVDRLAEGYRLGLELANRPEIRRLTRAAAPPAPTDDEALRRSVVENAYSIPHVVGTCAMGPSPDAGSVVDARGRVHGVEGLVIADASIIPEPPSGFPHVVTIMIAERIAELTLEGA